MFCRHLALRRFWTRFWTTRLFLSVVYLPSVSYLECFYFAKACFVPTCFLIQLLLCRGRGLPLIFVPFVCLACAACATWGVLQQDHSDYKGRSSFYRRLILACVRFCSDSSRCVVCSSVIVWSFDEVSW